MVSTRVVVHEIGPASLALLRYAIGVCCLLPPVLVTRRWRIETPDVLPIALLGILQFGILIALLNYALRFIPAARGALIFATVPLLTMVLAAALGRERLTGAKAAGVLLTIAGVAATLGEAALQHRGDANAWLGALAAFGSAGCGAVASVLYRPYLRRYPTLPVSALAMLASVGFLALLATREGFFSARLAFTVSGWTAVGFIGLASGVGYYLWLWALNNTTPTRVTVFLALSPITAAVLGAVMLGELLSAGAVFGLASVTLGLLIAHRE
jgi:drug/metabolite transporter (DMT)-like permease